METARSASALRRRLARDGFLLLPGVLPADACDALLCRLAAGDERGPVRQPGAVAADLEVLLARAPLRELLRGLMGPAARPVRTILFDKTGAVNWGVPWHQDRTIAVARRAEVPGFSRWSVKGGVPHVEPPIPLLEAMATLRLHLDRADADSGALEVLPGSHRLGRLTQPRIKALASETPGSLCAAEPGDVLVMKPLLVHRSRSARRPEHRRVLHVEFSVDALPSPLAWAFAEP